MSLSQNIWLNSLTSYFLALPWHALAGIVEILLFYSGAQCSILAVAACLVHSISGLMLVKNLRKGYSVITRMFDGSLKAGQYSHCGLGPTYQAGSILRPLAMMYAYRTGDRVDYHDALVPIHAFVYTRVMFFLCGSIGPTTSFRKNVNSKYIYLLAVFGGALIAVGHCSKPLAVPLYLMTVHAIGKLNFWTRAHVDRYRYVDGAPKSPPSHMVTHQ